MEQQQITVCVTGAAGQIAYSFIPLLLNGQVFRDKPIHLKLLDIPAMERVLKGVEMEILDGAYPLLRSVETGSDPKELFKDCDVVVFLGGFPRKPGMERKDLLQINGKIFKEQGEALNEVAKPEVQCVVVANPANTNSHILSTFAHKINRNNFTCMTRLDENRAYAQAAQHERVPVTDIEDIVVWGNHSTTQYPSVVYAKVRGQPIQKNEYYHQEFITKVQKRGGEVLQARGNSSVFSAANALKDHIRDLYFGTGSRLHSVGVTSDGSYNIPERLFFSFPVTLEGNFRYTIKQGLEVTEYCKKMIETTKQELLDEEADAGIKRE